MGVNLSPRWVVEDEVASKAARFRALLHDPALTFVMEAHNGLSARIVEETGFEAIWASGLTISASLGVRDNNEASWTQVLEILEFMSDATTVPILVDGDTGYGNFNNFRRLVRKLCARQIAAVCIEDKLFPKTNSFIGSAQPLAEIDEFCGKIKAGKDSQPDDDFSVIARVEALVSGWGADEALRRAEAYHAAGADAILIHSKSSKPDEVLAFAREWGNRAPLVIVPTMYYATPTQWFRDANISTIIWANHNLRAAMTAMQGISRHIFEQQSLVGVENDIAAVRDIFEITGNRELREAEERYLSEANAAAQGVVLAASRGDELAALTRDRPKCMIEVQGQPLLRRLVKSFNDAGVSDVTVVRGYRKEAIDLPSIATVDNDAFETTGEAASLHAAMPRIDGPAVVSFGDILFRKYVLDQLLEASGDIVLAVDARFARGAMDAGDTARAVDLVRCSESYTGAFLGAGSITVEQVGPNFPPVAADGRWIGLAKFSAAGAKALRDTLDAMAADGTLADADLMAVFARLKAGGATLHAEYVYGDWLDIHETADLLDAGHFWSRSV